MALSKRVFSEVDEAIPQFIWDRFPEKAKKLQRIVELEENIDQLLLSNIRSSHAINCEREIRPKVMRIYLHHKFVPQANAGEEKGHFVLTVEGQLLDHDSKYSVPFGSCFERIRIQPETGNKRQQVFLIDKQTEWSESLFPDGLKASCFRTKIYGDKAMGVRISLFRRGNVKPRYEVSAKLRMLLPNIRVDPTEDEVLLAVWQHLIVNNLFIDGKERKVIRCDDLLREITGMDSLLLSALKTKLFEELSPCKPIQIDYNLTTTDSKLDDRFNSVAMSKCGGKAVDIDVDILDTQTCSQLDALNTKAHEVAVVHARMVASQRQVEAQFIARAIHAKCAEIEEFEAFRQNPFATASEKERSGGGAVADVPEIVSRSADYQKLLLARKKTESREQASKPARLHGSSFSEGSGGSHHRGGSSGSKHGHGVPPTPAVRIPMVPDQLSAIHASRGFIDIGCDETFANQTQMLFPIPTAAVPNTGHASSTVQSSWKKDAAEMVVKIRSVPSST